MSELLIIRVPHQPEIFGHPGVVARAHGLGGGEFLGHFRRGEQRERVEP